MLIGCAAAAPPPLQLADIFAIEIIRDPQIAPDGRRIAYVRAFADIATDRRHTEIWVVDRDGGNRRRLAPGDSRAPRWSPDGRRIAYVATRAGKTDLYLTDLTGPSRRLTDGRHTVGEFAWAPDGTRLAVAMTVPTPPAHAGLRAAVKQAPPAGARWQPPPRIVDKAFYRADGAGYAEAENSQIFLVDAAGGTPRQLTTGPHDHPDGPIAWLPDGSALVFSANRHPEAEALTRAGDTDLWRLDIANGNVARLTTRFGPDSAPAVSPDGHSIAFVSAPQKKTHYEITGLSVLDLASGGIRALSGSLDRDIGTPAWSADGRHILVTYIDRGRTRLGRYDLAGGFTDLAAGLGSGVSAYGFGEAFSVAHDGSIAMNVTDPQTPSALAVLAPGAGAPRRIVDPNQALLATRNLSRVEELKITAPDGTPVQGWMMLPPGFDPARRYPLLLEIHGGPLGEYGFRFDFEKAAMAAAGYVVVFVNPRGSSGYGRDFANRIHHEFPGPDVQDLLAAVDQVAARPYIDAKRLYIAGGSAGGTLTGWIIGRTDRFAAAAMLYPAVNWESLGLTTDDLSYVPFGRLPGLPWEAPADYRRLSPLAHVASIRTPTLLITGEDDWRTPMAETEQFYGALKWLGVDTVMARFPGEGHGIRRYPSNVMAKLALMIDWFGGRSPP